MSHSHVESSGEAAQQIPKSVAQEGHACTSYSQAFSGSAPLRLLISTYNALESDL